MLSHPNQQRLMIHGRVQSLKAWVACVTVAPARNDAATIAASTIFSWDCVVRCLLAKDVLTQFRGRFLLRIPTLSPTTEKGYSRPQRDGARG